MLVALFDLVKIARHTRPHHFGWLTWGPAVEIWQSAPRCIFPSPRSPRSISVRPALQDRPPQCPAARCRVAHSLRRKRPVSRPRRTEPQFDYIVSNPPYIGLDEKPSLPRDVVAYEPHQALFSGRAGLDVLARLIAAAAATADARAAGCSANSIRHNGRPAGPCGTASGTRASPIRRRFDTQSARAPGSPPTLDAEPSDRPQRQS